MGVSKSNPPFRDSKIKAIEILTEKELEIINLFLNGENKLSAFLKVYPHYSALKNSELIRKNDLFWNLPKVNKYVRENQNNSR